MAKTSIPITTVAEWVEMGARYLSDGPPKRPHYEASLFVNRCRLRQRGERVWLERRHSCHFLNAPTQDDLDRQVAEFATRDDVRMLADDVDSNDFKLLPREQRPPPQDIIDGTAAVYAPRVAGAEAESGVGE